MWSLSTEEYQRQGVKEKRGGSFFFSLWKCRDKLDISRFKTTLWDYKARDCLNETPCVDEVVRLYFRISFSNKEISFKDKTIHLQQVNSERGEICAGGSPGKFDSLSNLHLCKLCTVSSSVLWTCHRKGRQKTHITYLCEGKTGRVN